MVGFQKQYLELQKNMNSENPRALRKNSKFANKSQISQKSQKPFPFGSGRFTRPSKLTVFRRVGQKNIHSKKRRLPKMELVQKNTP